MKDYAERLRMLEFPDITSQVVVLSTAKYIEDLEQQVGYLRNKMEAMANCAEEEVQSEFDVRTILIDVVPGDGSGLEIYAKDVADVERVISDLVNRLDCAECLAETFQGIADCKQVGHDKTSNCTKCGQDWLRHDFGVPYPTCPDIKQGEH